MSRLAHLLTQLTTTPTSQTQEKLASTYFETAPMRTPVVPPGTPPSRPAGLWLAGGIGVGLLIGALCSRIALRPAGVSAVSAPIVYPVLTFDELDIREWLGQRYGLWWGTPAAPHQQLELALDPEVHVGSTGRSLHVDYALGHGGAGVINRPALGVWFKLPMASRAIPGQLEFMIRGDGQPDHLQQTTLELRSRNLVEQHAIAIGPDWSAIRVPLAVRVDPSGELTVWSEFRILLGPDGASGTSHGRIYIDQIRLATVRP